MAPVPPGVQVAEFEVLHKAQVYLGHGPRDLPGDEGLPAAGALVVEEDAVAGEHAVRLPVVHHNPIGVQLGSP